AFSAIFYPASCGPSLRAAFRSKQPAEEVSLSCLACHAFSLMHEAYFASSPFRLIGLKPFSAYRPVLCRNDFLHHQRTLQSSPRLSTDHSSIGLEGVSGQRRRSKWRVRLGRCLALPDLLSHELSRGQATGLYQRSFGLRSMASPKWLIAIGFNLHSLHITVDATLEKVP